MSRGWEIVPFRLSQSLFLSRNGAAWPCRLGAPSLFPDAFAVPCNVIDTAAKLTAIRHRSGVPEVVVHNAVGGAFADSLDVDPNPLPLPTRFFLSLTKAVQLGPFSLKSSHSEKTGECNGGA